MKSIPQQPPSAEHPVALERHTLILELGKPQLMVAKWERHLTSKVPGDASDAQFRRFLLVRLFSSWNSRQEDRWRLSESTKVLYTGEVWDWRKVQIFLVRHHEVESQQRLQSAVFRFNSCDCWFTEMNRKRDQEELQTFGSNYARRSLFHSKTLPGGDIERMFVSVNKPQVPKWEDWSHLSNSTEQKLGVPPLKSTPPAGNNRAAGVVKTPNAAEEKSSTLKMRLEAMTWAAMAKDVTIHTLQQKLTAALLSLQKERDQNAQLRIELDMFGRDTGESQLPSESDTEKERLSAENPPL
ncbi:hypothetical protein R1sor_022849 [Riccia sorocarpa]|uniref:Uncharacterized protein n=1 Tax=Riccia sorocarpa TaxID=122646 RepID=A0ABD3GL28_9MARC